MYEVSEETSEVVVESTILAQQVGDAMGSWCKQVKWEHVPECM